MQNDKFIELCKERKEQNIHHCDVPITVIDQFLSIWNQVFPHRKIKFDDAKVIAFFEKEDSSRAQYNGKDMSDGERVALYLIAQCLCIQENKTIIIDEPEIHLHRSIMNKLWNYIENERKDCLFIYITHDTQFASMHKQAEKIFVKEFDGTKWKWEKVNDSFLPEQLLLDIIGNRQNVLFVEGDSNSYDTKLYSEIYKNYYVIPCGSCTNVIANTKAMNSNGQLHHLKAYGIIDRDYRCDYEIESYRSDNIYTLKVAEVENLFLVEELLEIVNDNSAFFDKSRVEQIKDYIINERFLNQIERQICESVVSELKYKLSCIEISNKNEDQAKQALDDSYEQIKYDLIKQDKKQIFETAAAKKDYKEILKVFNQKSLSKSIGHFLNVDNKDYCSLVIRLLQREKSQQIIAALKEYLPEEIQI